ncbi:MAG: restriction endonuclease subunit S [Oscillospiraceae bacterium]|nr:restriction endonuclease subunit S [Oscillospiraceae bacterium]
MISNVICNSAKQGLIPQREYFDKDIANSDNTNGYYIIESNDFVYNPRKSADAPYGPISSYQYPEAGIVSPLYLCFRAKREINPLYFEWYFRSSAWHRYIYMSGDSGARHDRVSIKDDVFFAMPINVPSAKEQERISLFLDAIERRIETQRTLVETLKKYKRGLSDTLFDRIAQSPSCKIVKLGDAFELLQNNTFSRDDLTTNPSSVQNIHYGDVLVKYGAVVNISEDTPPYIKPTIDLQKFVATSYLRDGDIVFADTAEDYSVGKATEIAGANGLAVLSGLHTIPCRPLMKFHPMYLAYYFNSSLFRRQIYPLVQGTKVSSISKGELVKTSVYAPTEREQRRIASMLYLLDLRITFEEKTVNALTNARTALLQQLFI